MRLDEVAKAVNGVLQGYDEMIEGVSTDTRRLRSGELFVALRGPHFNGHRFIDDARQHHAAAAMIEEAVATELATIQVTDTRTALAKLAAYWRDKFHIPVIGITGSNGKTTVKEMIGSILASANRNALVTEGNLNNEIGVPLTLLRLRSVHRYAVVEMGMNHMGEIDRLTRMTRPTIALITNAAAAHLEGVRDLDAVARAKAEIFNGLGRGGIAVINGDDAFADFWRERAAPHSCLVFALNSKADVNGEYEFQDHTTRILIKTTQGNVDVHLRLPGLHNVANALAATCAVLPLGVDLDDIKAGLESIGPVRGRLQVRAGLRGVTILDDTYNANPASARAAIDVLARSAGWRLLVLGDMAELGAEETGLHRDIGRYAREQGIDALFAVGPLSRAAVEAFGDRARHFETHDLLASAVRALASQQMTVLVKGSRRMHMEDIVSVLAADGTPADRSVH